MTSRTNIAKQLRVTATAIAALLAVGQAASSAGSSRATRTVIVTPPSGPAANGSSANPTFSGDPVTARMLAFDTAASNLVRGDSNGRRDVVVFIRGRGEGNLSGRLVLASRATGLRGRLANGDSVRPSLDGQAGDGARAPHCVTFESQATNLDRRDRSRDWDVYLRDIRTRRTRLVSAGHRADAVYSTVDGQCATVTYQSGGAVFVRDLRARRTARIARGTAPAQQTDGKGVTYERDGQIYYRAYHVEDRRGLVLGRERLVSDTADGAPGNGVSINPAIDDIGRNVVFQSTATNLCVSRCHMASSPGIDRNGAVSDVFRRSMSKKAPASGAMEMVSYSYGADAQGDGPSTNGPRTNGSSGSVTGAGETVVFDSEATNLRRLGSLEDPDMNGPMSDVYLWHFSPSRGTGNVERASRPGANSPSGGFFDGPSFGAAASPRAHYLAFVSTQSGQSGESNGSGIADVFIRYTGG
jgi:hypothetical protein